MSSHPTPISQAVIDSFHSISKDPRLTRLREALGSFEGLYLVGGVVRDVLLGEQNKDIDLAIDKPIEEAIKALQKANVRVITTGLQHDTVAVLPIPELPVIEITACRIPSDWNLENTKQQRAIERDLQGRDFTINSIAYSLQNNELIDPLNGISDLENKLVKAVGSPVHRFKEDPLRILRMIRFASTLEMEIEADTFSATCSLVSMLKDISMERIRDEFNLILQCQTPSKAIGQLQEIKALEFIVPELCNAYGFEQNEYHEKDVFHHTLDVLDKVEPDLILRWGALLHDIGKPDSLSVDEEGMRHFYMHESLGTKTTQSILERLKCSKSFIKAVSTLVKTHMRPIDAKTPGIRRILRDTGEQYARWRALKEADALSCRFDTKLLYSQLETFDKTVEEINNTPALSPLKSLAINGKDLIAIGIPESPNIGVILKALYKHTMDYPEDNVKDKLIELARKKIKNCG